MLKKLKLLDLNHTSIETFLIFWMLGLRNAFKN